MNLDRLSTAALRRHVRAREDRIVSRSPMTRLLEESGVAMPPARIAALRRERTLLRQVARALGLDCAALERGLRLADSCHELERSIRNITQGV